ncbi:hypothetical protein ACWDSL_09615 [Streptomyces sp. NPDC000941]
MGGYDHDEEQAVLPVTVHHRDGRRESTRLVMKPGQVELYMNWLDEKSITLVGLRQEDLDLWLTTHPTRHRGLAAFIHWAVARHLTGKGPPKLAVLIEQRIASPSCRTSVLQQPHDGESGFLFPGRPPNRPRSAEAVHHALRQHGLPGISARNTAMIEAITDLPSIVVSDLFGIHPSTTYAWSQFAQNSWTDYLAAVQATE